MISANPGVNPSLSITAISERAMCKMPSKNDNPDFK
jgi:cholesterol oxidase